MPRVGKKHFPYTPKGKADARKERLVDAMERAQNESSRLQTNDAMRRGGYDRKPGLRPVPGRAPYRPHPNPPPKGFRPPKKTSRTPPPYVGKTKTPNYGGSDR
jgi:hypothetical protein